jgi:hypothetical protein
MEFQRMTFLQMLLVFLALFGRVNAVRGQQLQQQQPSRGQSSTSSASTHIQRLHEQLAIDTTDPREDIRTNRLLNMEGF